MQASTPLEAFENIRSPLLTRLGRKIDRQTAFGLVHGTRSVVVLVLPAQQVASLPEVPEVRCDRRNKGLIALMSIEMISSLVIQSY